MAYRNLTGIDDKILRAIWQLGAKDGVRKVTARKVGALCGVSDYTVFCHFGNSNRGFLDAAAKHFFSLHLEPLLERMAQGGTFAELWNSTLDTLLCEIDGALYFRNYCTAFFLSDFLFPAEKREDVAAALTVACPELNTAQRLLMLDHFFSCAFHYAEYFSRGDAQNTAADRAFLCSLLGRTFGETDPSN